MIVHPHFDLCLLKATLGHKRMWVFLFILIVFIVYASFLCLVQVLAGCVYPPLLEDRTFPVDVRQRSETLLDACEERSVGSYTDSSGLDHVRHSIAEFITSRDGVPCSASNVFISGGSQRVMVKLLAGTEWDFPTGVLTPMPPPLTLPMLLDEAGVSLEPYRLNKDHKWAVNVDELYRTLTTARWRCKPRAIFISNPSNPTGHVQSRKSIQEVIRFAAAAGLLLLVDEVYQEYVFGDGLEFISYKKILFEMGPPYSDTVEMASFYSISSIGECGLRAGFMELVNIDPRVMHFVDTMLCTDISTPVMGQLALDLMVKPPKPGDASYHTYTEVQPKNTPCEVLNNLPGVSCESAVGGVYLYPCVNVPVAVVTQAEAGALYCDLLMEEQAVLIGPGCSCGPPAGTCHFRYKSHLCFVVLNI
uniref:alanine transaminase n=1 Tax=Periophthalmus magnuspinnatus TaxID=409849 RepID=A0A3B4APR6_9GOBI